MVIDADEGVVEQYHMVDRTYQLILKSGEGHIRSFAVPGFVIPIPAIFDEDVSIKTMTAILQSEAPASSW